eukprot:TRINITY_DN8260_c0_g1_i1.p1 TRINITY_DN8260_c0_g1~~TRINITY_DN8260_c0_g1_i1.p1  ORF type:complete len:350 (+),score=76.35 TRINITY_DN8260_c0_g1_i1:196-1245(+)
MIVDEPSVELSSASSNTPGTDVESQQRSQRAGEQYQRQRQGKLAERVFLASWAVNVFLLGAKVGALIATNYSKAVAASLADSFVDVLLQVVLSFVQHLAKRPNEHYPVGRGRLEAIGVISCSCIMTIASLEVLQFAIEDLIHGLNGDVPSIDANATLYVVLGGGTLAKFVLWWFCMMVRPRPDVLVALAEDHLNDVVSNVAAIATAAIAGEVAGAWWADPAGAIVISVWIMWRWSKLTLQQVGKIVGKVAPPEFITRCEALAQEHFEELQVDSTCAYHWGSRYMVEMEVILPADTVLSTSHDIALELQHKLEAIEEVERAFVHVDYMKRACPEHKVERKLLEQKNERVR